MSWWTEVFLSASLLEDTSTEDAPLRYSIIDSLNAYLSEKRLGELFLVANPDPERHTPNSCFMAYCKNLDRETFAQLVRQAPWKWKEQVQLFYRQEDDRGFQEVKLWE